MRSLRRTLAALAVSAAVPLAAAQVSAGEGPVIQASAAKAAATLVLTKSSAPRCPGDADGDGRIGHDDLEIVLFYMGTAQRGPAHGDLTGDGRVTQEDLDEVIFYFGQACPRAGDVNADGHVTQADLDIVLFNFGRSGVEWGKGDLTGDKRVDQEDLDIVLFAFATPPACPGDATGDGRVDQDDIDVVLFNLWRSGASRAEGDLTGDGRVDQDDIDMLLFTFATSCTASSAPSEPAGG